MMQITLRKLYAYVGALLLAFTPMMSLAGTLGEGLNAPSLEWTTGGNADWFAQTALTHDGEDATRSGVISGNQSTWMQTTVTGPKQVRFWWKVSSESGYDFLRFYVDDVEKAFISGTGADWAQQAVNVTGTGAHTLKWQYSKDSSVNNGDDCGWVDQVTIANVPLGEAKTYYVNGTTGDDSNSGLSASAAKKTIQAAVDTAAEGSTILVAAGTYRESIQIDHKLTLWGVNGPTETFIQGSSENTVVRIVAGAEDSVVRGFDISGGTGVPCSSSYGYDYYGGGVNAGVVSTVRDCIVHGNGHGTARVNAGTFGGGLCGPINAVNCLIYDNFAWACGGGTFGSNLDHCTVYENNSTDFFGYQGGVALAYDCSIVVSNSIIWGNDGAQIDAYASPYNRNSAVTVSYCCVQGGTSANNIERMTVGDGNISSDPCFADDVSLGLPLSANSPCKGADSDGGDMGFSLSRIENYEASCISVGLA